MKKTLLNFGSLVITSLVLSGCVTQQEFFPKKLNGNARGIATVKSTPYGCKALGEVEGKDSSAIQSEMVVVVGNTLSAVREGAMNDLRNNAVEVVGNSSKRTVLKIVYERAFCTTNAVCQNQRNTSQSIHSYLVKAEIFECGDK